MYSNKTMLFRRSPVLTFALMLCALCALPTRAGDLVLRHEVSSGSSTFVSFGPLGPKCDGVTVFDDCTFFTTTSTSSGKDDPGGPFTATGTTTLYFGLNDFAYTVNGASNPDGTPGGFCLPVFGTSHAVYANGTIDTNTQGSVCCAAGSSGSCGVSGIRTTYHLSRDLHLCFRDGEVCGDTVFRGGNEHQQRRRAFHRPQRIGRHQVASRIRRPARNHRRAPESAASARFRARRIGPLARLARCPSVSLTRLWLNKPRSRLDDHHRADG